MVLEIPNLESANWTDNFDISLYTEFSDMESSSNFQWIFKRTKNAGSPGFNCVSFSSSLSSIFFFHELLKPEENTLHSVLSGSSPCLDMLHDVSEEWEARMWKRDKTVGKVYQGEHCYSQLVHFPILKGKHCPIHFGLPFLMAGGCRAAVNCLPLQCQQLAQSSSLPRTCIRQQISFSWHSLCGSD